MSCKAGLRHHPVRVRKAALSEALLVRRAGVPLPAVMLPPPDLSAWQQTNTGVPGVITLDTGKPGPDCVIVALVHGNELAGGHVLEHLRTAPQRLATGRLTLIAANLAAFNRFQKNTPLTARFVDEDMNRVWNTQRLRGSSKSYELTRAREIEPFIRRADLLLDLHSTLWDSEPFFIASPVKRSADFACGLAAVEGVPPCVVADLGHQGGARLIEHDHFAATVGAGRACLLEAGQHWQPQTVNVMQASVDALLTHAQSLHLHAQVQTAGQKVQSVFVTDNVVARSSDFAFTQKWAGNTCIAQAGTIIARDGRDVIYTPYDDCVLVVPNHQPRVGQLAVRLARRTAV